MRTPWCGPKQKQLLDVDNEGGLFFIQGEKHTVLSVEQWFKLLLGYILDSFNMPRILC